MDFERGLDPKRAMGIGGINLQEKYDETVGAWQKYFEQFIGKTVRFRVNSNSYTNWSDRVKSGELVEIKTMTVQSAQDNFFGCPGHLFFMEKDSLQCWFVDLSENIYIIK